METGDKVEWSPQARLQRAPHVYDAFRTAWLATRMASYSNSYNPRNSIKSLSTI
jgi:hypothetical protein